MVEFAVPVDPEQTVAVFVDMQNDYVHSDGGLPRALDYETDRLERDAAQMASFLESWRDRDLSTVHVRTHQSAATNSTVWQNRYPDRDVAICEPGTWGAAFYDGLEPAADEPVVTKHRYSGFADTNMDLVLRSNDVETLVLCGCLTHVCVEATARDAFHRDYAVVLASDACTTTDAFADLHDATLRNVGRFYGDVAPCADVLSAVDEQTVAAP